MSKTYDTLTDEERREALGRALEAVKRFEKDLASLLKQSLNVSTEDWNHIELQTITDRSRPWLEDRR